MIDAGTSDAADPRQTTLLIVEDEAVMRHTVRKFLQLAYPQWTILEAEGGAQALAACSARRPGVVLIDICLPDIDGITLAPQVKTLLPGCGVVFVSYLDGATYIERALAAGGCAYVVKDRLFTDLLPAIAAAVGRPLPLPG